MFLCVLVQHKYTDQERNLFTWWQLCGLSFKLIQFVELEGLEVAIPGFYDESTGYSTAIDVAGRGALNSSQMQENSNDKFRAWSGNLHPNEPSPIDQWGASENFAASISYSIVNDLYIGSQATPFGAMVVAPGERRNLDGSSVNQAETEDAFIGSLTYLVPQSKGANLFKRLNAAQFSKTFKGNLAKLSADTRGQVNRLYNKAVDMINNNNTAKNAVRQTFGRMNNLNDAIMGDDKVEPETIENEGKN